MLDLKRRLYTPDAVTLKSGIVGYGTRLFSESVVQDWSLSVVKTDLNCLLSNSAFSAGVVTTLPSTDFKVPIPVLSCLFDLI